MTQLNEMQVRLLNHIEDEMDMIIYLRRKYDLSFKLYSRLNELLYQQEAVLTGNFLFEKIKLSENRVMANVYFDNSTSLTCQYVENQEGKNIANN